MKMKITGNGARNLNKAALNSGRASKRRLMNSSRLNSSRWDWDAWDDYAKQISVSPQIAKAVAQYADGDGELEIEKVLQPTGDVGAYLKRVGIKALIFVYDPTDREGYEEILGWTGSGINDDSPFNLTDIQNKAFDGGFDVDSSKGSMNCSEKLSKASRRPRNSSRLNSAVNNEAMSVVKKLETFCKSIGEPIHGYESPMDLYYEYALMELPEDDDIPYYQGADAYRLTYAALADKGAVTREAIEAGLESFNDRYPEAKITMNSSRKPAVRRQLNSNHKATRRPAVNAASRRPLAPVATERPMLNSSARRPVARLTNTKADLKSSRRPARPLANDDKNYKLNSARRRPLKKLNSNRSTILKELEGWFSKDEAVEYLDSFEKETGATATKLATDDEVDKYDGVFWATKDGKESLWCLHNGMWVEEDLDSSKKLNSAEGEATEEAASTETPEESTAEEATSEETTSEEEIEVTDLLIVQDPESKELSLFIPDTPEEAVPEDVEVIATVEVATAEDLDSSCGGKKKLNSSEENGAEAATEDEAKEDEAKESESTEEEAVVELPDGETVEVEDIFVVQTDDGEYDLFIAEEDAELPEEVEVVGEAVAVDEDEILNSSRQLKKLNSSKNTDKKATK